MGYEVGPRCSLDAIPPFSGGRRHVDWRPFPLQEDMYRPIPVADQGLTDLLDPQLEVGLLAALGLVGIEGAINPQGFAGPTHRHLPGLPHHIDKLAPAGRL
ncbi:hypothetical protein D3C87_1768530 [compost metagenome]